MSSTKSLTLEQNARLRASLNRVHKQRKEQYGENMTEFAAKLGIKQGTLSDIMSGKKGGGGKVLLGLAKVAPEEALMVTGGARAGMAADTLAMARAAAENLARAGLASPEEAWALMREIHLHEPDIHGFYLEAVRRLSGRREVEDPAAKEALSRRPGARVRSAKKNASD